MTYINTQMQIGSRSEDVRKLQQFLNSQGFAVAAVGQPGSAGMETDYFGPATQAALQRYQASKGIVSSGDPTSTGYGRLGPQTLAAINSDSVSSIGSGSQNVQEQINKIQFQVQEAQSAGYSSNQDIQYDSSGKIIPASSVKDPRIESLPPELQDLYGTLEEYLNSLVQQGKTINPDVTITPEQTAAFLEQAKRELSPYYSGQIEQAKQDLLSGVKSLVASERETVPGLERQYRQSLLEGQEFFAESGMAQSGRRNVFEKELAQATGETLTNLSRITGESVESLGSGAAKLLGTENIRSLAFPERSMYSVTPGQTRFSSLRAPAFSPVGNVIGTLQREQTVSELTRQSQLEEAERKRKLSQYGLI